MPDPDDDPHRDERALATAALAGDPAAQRAIDQLIRAEAERAVIALRQPAWLVDEVHQELAQRLLVGDQPRLASYAGQSALGRWLGVAATRTALNLIRSRKPQVALDDDDDAIVAAIADPDVALMRERYRDEVSAAVRAAFEALENARDRNLLRLYYFERVGVVELGQMYRVHASTVSRWLAALREHIVADTQFRLAERLGLAGHYDDLASVIRALRSDLDLTLSRLLR
jgi:RNA polymerase sigma-70 factor (ECF subfamily)